MRVVRLCLALLGMLTMPLCSADEQIIEPPSLELLEYLSEWEDEQGEWLDPLSIEEQQQVPAVTRESNWTR